MGVYSECISKKERYMAFAAGCPAMIGVKH